jgi:hypothetical protein
LNFRPRPSNGARRRQNVPVATGTHSGQNTTPPTRAAPQGIRPRRAVGVCTRSPMGECERTIGCSMRWLTRHAGSHGSRSSCRQANATAPPSAVCLTDAGRFVRCVRCSRRRPVAVIGLLDAIYLGGAVEGPSTLRSGRGVLAASVCLLAVRSGSCQCARNRWGVGSTSMNVLKPTPTGTGAVRGSRRRCAVSSSSTPRRASRGCRWGRGDR